MSTKTSTAALETFSHRPFPARRRVPRHPAADLTCSLFDYSDENIPLLRRRGLQPPRKASSTKWARQTLGFSPGREAPLKALFLRSSRQGMASALPQPSPVNPLCIVIPTPRLLRARDLLFVPTPQRRSTANTAQNRIPPSPTRIPGATRFNLNPAVPSCRRV